MLIGPQISGRYSLPDYPSARLGIITICFHREATNKVRHGERLAVTRNFNNSSHRLSTNKLHRSSPQGEAWAWAQ